MHWQHMGNFNELDIVDQWSTRIPLPQPFEKNRMTCVALTFDLLTHPLMQVIICAKYGKNPSKSVCAIEWTWQDVTYFSSFIAKPWMNDLEEFKSRSKIIMPDIHSHPNDHLCIIWKEPIQNCRRYIADTACRMDGQTDGMKLIYPNNIVLRGYSNPWKNFQHIISRLTWWNGVQLPVTWGSMWIQIRQLRTWSQYWFNSLL